MSEEKVKARENEIFIGKKPIYVYINSVQKLLNDGHKEIIISSRGKSNSMAIDVALNRQYNNLIDENKTKITAHPESFEGKAEGDKGRIVTLSNIEIIIYKKE